MLSGEFIGLLRLSGVGASVFTSHFAQCRKAHAQGRFQQAARFSQAYITDFLQELIMRGEVVESCPIVGGWMEIDTPQDLERARLRYAT